MSANGGGFLQRLGLARPEARAWAMYDWANSAMVVTVITAVFPIYFLRVAARDVDETRAQELYSWTTTAALALVAVVAPVLGALADVRGMRKRFLLGFASLGILAAGGLFFVEEGDWRLGLVLFGLANLGAAGSVVFYDALLPHVAPPEETDRLSTSGYALGYVGGGVLLAAALAWIENPGLLGLSEDSGTLPTRLAFVAVAAWWGVFTVPLLRRVPEPPRTYEPDEHPGQNVVRTSFRRLLETLRELRRYRQAFRMLVAFLIYNDGIQTIIRMAAIYAAAQSLDDAVVVATILAIQFVGIPFAFLFGLLAPRFGAKRLVLFGLVVYAAISILAYHMDANWHFVALGALVGCVQGGTQGLSRSLFASLIPRHKSGEFFAFFAVGEKFAGIFGPWIFGTVIVLTGSPQTAILSVIVFFLVGGGLLLAVDVEAGRRLAREVDAEVGGTAPSR